MKFPFRFQRGRESEQQAIRRKTSKNNNNKMAGVVLFFKKAKNKKGENIFTADLEQSGVNGRASGVRSAARVIASVIDRHLIF
jgi:hypothetical protein